MSFEEFLQQLSASAPDPGWSPLLKGLWYDANGDWDQSHRIVQDIHTPEAARIHAYLHRKEGDIGNADYWYSLSGTKRKDWTLEEEWNYLVKAFMDAS